MIFTTFELNSDLLVGMAPQGWERARTPGFVRRVPPPAGAQVVESEVVMGARESPLPLQPPRWVARVEESNGLGKEGPQQQHSVFQVSAAGPPRQPQT